MGFPLKKTVREIFGSLIYLDENTLKFTHNYVLNWALRKIDSVFGEGNIVGKHVNVARHRRETCGNCSSLGLSRENTLLTPSFYE